MMRLSAVILTVCLAATASRSALAQGQATTGQLRGNSGQGQATARQAQAYAAPGQNAAQGQTQGQTQGQAQTNAIQANALQAGSAQASSGQATGQAGAGQAQQTPTAPAPPSAPFVLSAVEQSEMDQLLVAWEKQSMGTKQLEAKFRRWHFDLLAAPAGVHATWAEGMVKYSAPDKGLFQVTQLKFFSGIVESKPTYKTVEGQFGEHWVCNGQELMEFDHSRKECRIQQLPPDMQGKEILESPLPFVFNLNAEKIKDRYWIRRLEAQPGIYLLEAHPKRQADRAQYRFVRIVINDQSFLPQALILYGPNFDPVTSPGYDQYEFTDVERNTLRQGVATWSRLFINQKPPADWKVVRETYRPAGPESPQIAQPGGEKSLR